MKFAATFPGYEASLFAWNRSMLGEITSRASIASSRTEASLFLFDQIEIIADGIIGAAIRIIRKQIERE